MALPFDQKSKLSLFSIVNGYLLKPQIQQINLLLYPLLNDQKELCLIPENTPIRFIYRGKEYRSLEDIESTAWAKAHPLHKSLHSRMPAFLALFEPYELASARIKSIIVNACAFANTVADLKQLIPAEALTQVSFASELLTKPQTLLPEEIEAFKTKHSQYLFAIHEALFKHVLLDF